MNNQLIKLLTEIDDIDAIIEIEDALNSEDYYYKKEVLKKYKQIYEN